MKQGAASRRGGELRVRSQEGSVMCDPSGVESSSKDDELSVVCGAPAGDRRLQYFGRRNLGIEPVYEFSV